MNTKKQLSRGANSCLDEINIQYEKLTAFGLDIHKVQLSQIKEIPQLDHIYQELNIFLPPNIKSSRFIRQLEFLTGRLAAKYALQSFNLQDSIVYQGRHGEPLWPEGVMGVLVMLDQKSCYAIAYARNNTPKKKNIWNRYRVSKTSYFFKRKMNFMMFFSIKTSKKKLKSY